MPKLETVLFGLSRSSSRMVSPVLKCFDLLHAGSVSPLLLSSSLLWCQLMFFESPGKIPLRLPGTQQTRAEIQPQALGVLVSSYWSSGGGSVGQQRLCRQTGAGVWGRCWALHGFCCCWVGFCHREPCKKLLQVLCDRSQG